MAEWMTLIRTDGFWGGVASSIFATVVLAILATFARTTFAAANKRNDKEKRFEDMVVSALNLGGTVSNAAIAFSNARCLKYFLMAVFVAYVGDVLGVIWPFNIFLYAGSLVFIWFGLRWAIRVEKVSSDALSSHFHSPK